MTYLCILGRQPELGLAELRALYGHSAVKPFSDNAALVETSNLVVESLGGTIKLGKVIHTIDGSNWNNISSWIRSYYVKQWRANTNKQTLGMSIYGLTTTVKLIQKAGLQIKSELKSSGVSLRLIPNNDLALSSAVSHHNKLGLSPNKTELLIVSNGVRTFITESRGAQNITALAARDQGRPKRDAFVGMLPPKLALMMINLAQPNNNGIILDPFCGTGVVLQEGLLRNYNVYGSDLSEKMVDYSMTNLKWLIEKYNLKASYKVTVGDAMDNIWQQPISSVVSEVYLGQPFSAPPSPEKLQKVMKITEDITLQFLSNLSKQIKSGIPICLAIPAWRGKDGNIDRLTVASKISKFGFTIKPGFENLYYYRDTQVVARELIVAVRN